MILVSGATGNLGSEICRRLVAKGERVRGMVRATSDPAKVAQLQRLGVETVVADLKDRESLAAPCRGAQVVISGATSVASTQPGDSIETVDRLGQLNMVDAARKAGVEHFVFVSFSADIDSEDPAPLTVAKRQVEKAIQESGMAYTILRPSYFMEIWLGPVVGFDYANAKAAIYGDGRYPISWISLQDVAEVAARCPSMPEMRGAVLEMGGPEPVSPLDVVRTFEEAGGRPFEVQHVPTEALRAQKAGSTDLLQKSFTSLMLAYAKGNLVDTTAMQQAFPLELVTVTDYAIRVLVST